MAAALEDKKEGIGGRGRWRGHVGVGAGEGIGQGGYRGKLKGRRAPRALFDGPLPWRGKKPPRRKPQRGGHGSRDLGIEALTSTDPKTQEEAGPKRGWARITLITSQLGRITVPAHLMYRIFGGQIVVIESQLARSRWRSGPDPPGGWPGLLPCPSGGAGGTQGPSPHIAAHISK